MALDAFVFLNKKHLKYDPEKVGAKYEPKTGEYYFTSERLENKYPIDDRIACARFIGNIVMVERLRAEARRALPESSVVLSGVLYDGTHTGDFIGRDFLPALEKELELLRINDPTPRMLNFLENMDELLKAAKEEENPIVF